MKDLRELTFSNRKLYDAIKNNELSFEEFDECLTIIAEDIRDDVNGETNGLDQDE